MFQHCSRTACCSILCIASIIALSSWAVAICPTDATLPTDRLKLRKYLETRTAAPGMNITEIQQALHWSSCQSGRLAETEKPEGAAADVDDLVGRLPSVLPCRVLRRHARTATRLMASRHLGCCNAKTLSTATSWGETWEYPVWAARAECTRSKHGAGKWQVRARTGPSLRGRANRLVAPRAALLPALSGHSRGRPSLRRSFPKPALRGYVQHHLPAQSQQRGTFLPFAARAACPPSADGYARTVAPEPLNARYAQ